MLTESSDAEHDARALSDGTLRFLALAIVEEDPEALGVICLEEPENGIHPERIPAMLDLLENIAMDPEEPEGDGNPLRQVLVNTHSTEVVGQVADDDLLMVVTENRILDGKFVPCPAFRALPNTWRTETPGAESALAPGKVVSLLNASEEPVSRREPRALEFATGKTFGLISNFPCPSRASSCRRSARPCWPKARPTADWFQ